MLQKIGLYRQKPEIFDEPDDRISLCKVSRFMPISQSHLFAQKCVFQAVVVVFQAKRVELDEIDKS